jgi:hypothetical protein
VEKKGENQRNFNCFHGQAKWRFKNEQKYNLGGDFFGLEIAIYSKKQVVK